MKRRLWIYILLGLAFGNADWYYLQFLAEAGKNPALNNWIISASTPVRLLAVAVLVALNYGIWLVPVIPAAIYESRRTHSIGQAAFAAVLVWVAAMVSYYTYYAILLTFVGLPQMEFMLYSNRGTPGYWLDYWPMFGKVILAQFVEWSLFAIVAGTIVGAAIGLLDRRRMKKYPAAA